MGQGEDRTERWSADPAPETAAQPLPAAARSSLELSLQTSTAPTATHNRALLHPSKHTQRAARPPNAPLAVPLLQALHAVQGTQAAAGQVVPARQLSGAQAPLPGAR